MSDRFPYPGDNSIIIQDGSIIWNDQSHDQSLQYMDANDTINESYVTATDSNETQYFSILEHSNDITLEDLHNLTIGNADSQENVVFTEEPSPAVGEETTQENKDEDEGTQVLVFSVDGTDDLYGIQFTQDEEGHIQKYQFKFRTTAEGQLEAIPESIQLLTDDDQSTIETESEQVEIDHTTLVEAPVDNQSDQEDDQVDAPQKEVKILQGQVVIKGERQSPIPFKELRETENFGQKPQHDCEDFVQQEEHTETVLEQFSIKTEIMERNIQVESNEPCICRDLNVKQEHFTEDVGISQEIELEDDVDEESIQPQADNYEEVEQSHVIIKQQPQETMSEEGNDIFNDQDDITLKQQLENSQSSTDAISEEEEIVETSENPLNQEELVQQFMHDNCQIEVEYETEPEDPERPSQECQFEEIYNVKEHQKEYADNYVEATALNANNDSDSEQYEIVEGLHVTGEINEEPEEEVVTTTDTEPVLHEVMETYKDQTVNRTNILKHPVVNTDKEEKMNKTLVSVKYYVVYPEKENVNSLADNTTTQLPATKLSRPNPRSVLRTSFVKPKGPEKHGKVVANTFPECDLFHKRFAKNKEAMRAKLFHNFLNRTTIPHAPIRQQRQPRKQEIKPVIERSDEEIIVQEVMVSSNGFVESMNQKMHDKKLQVTAVVELSDSEDDSNLKINKHRRSRKAHHIPRQTSESELSVIEICSDEETGLSKKDNLGGIVKRGKGRPKKSNTENQPITLKRRRGRPPKKSKLPIEETSTNLELSPTKRNRTQSEEVKEDKESSVSDKSEIISEKKEIACPKCPKTFPSQNSLNTHIIHHNLENSLKNKVVMTSRPSIIPRQSLLPKVEYSHKCENCQQSFKNSILLNRHNCIQKTSSLSCCVCLKQFRDVAMLNIHKKSHVKSNLVNNTSVVKISPKKSLHGPSTSLIKSPKTKSIKTVPTNVFKCKQCSKICDSERSLTAHTNLHKKFLCSSCSATFSSRLLLDTHVRTNCVKMRSPANKRLSFKIKKSFIHTPPKRQSVCKPTEKRFSTTLNQSVTSLNLECEKCQMKFSTFRTLYTHKVQKHGLNTPDKSLIGKPKQGIYKPRAAHGGIPANDRLKKAYAALRQKLAEMQDKSNIAA